MSSRDCRVYVGNLPSNCRNKDLEDIFGKYGKINYVDLKGRPNRGPPFGFLEFDDPRDAEDAVRGRDGYDFDGYRLRVEFTRGAGPRGPGGRPLYENGRSGSGRHSPPRHSRGGGGGRGSNYRVTVTGLPQTGSWQDLKDHMREAGEVCFADVFRDGTGVVEYLKYDDMKYALKKLDDTKFKSHEGESSYIRVKEADDKRGGGGGSGGGRGRGSSRSRSRSPRSRSRSPRRSSPVYSPRRSRSNSRSRSRSNSRSRSRSHSR